MPDRHAQLMGAPLLVAVLVLSYPWLAHQLDAVRVAGIPATLLYLMAAWAGLIAWFVARPPSA